jgi:hypothetical protein
VADIFGRDPPDPPHKFHDRQKKPHGKPPETAGTEKGPARIHVDNQAERCQNDDRYSKKKKNSRKIG